MPPISAPNQSRAQALLGFSTILLFLPYPFFILRIWARWIKKLGLSLNDYLLFLALIFTSGYNASMIVASIKGGYGQHWWTLSMDEMAMNLKLTVAATLLWPTANTLIKLSVLHFYQAIFPGRKLVYIVYSIAVLTLAYWFGTVMTAFLICRPFEYNWNKITIPGHCGDLMAYYLSTGIVNLLIDIIIVGLPLPLLWSLQMPTSKKIYIICIFSLGALICIISIARVVAIKKLNFADVTYDIVLDNTTTALEPTLGVINACLPLLKPVVSKLSGMQISTWFKSLRSRAISARHPTVTELRQQSTKERPDKTHRLSLDLYPLANITITQQTDISFTQQSMHSVER